MLLEKPLSLMIYHGHFMIYSNKYVTDFSFKFYFCKKEEEGQNEGKANKNMYIKDILRVLFSLRL